ncbi:MAG: hypothetical protein Q9160_003342 [Pyrenula sp. 1 TL-2023]
MRYKASYSPQHILDPETLSWIPLDDKVQRALDKKSYVAFSREISESNPDEKFSEGEKMKENGNAYKETPLGSGTEEESDDEIDYPEGSLFKYRVPGILSKEEVETRCDLDHWKLVTPGSLVDMKDLVGWKAMDITDPLSLKGIVAELAASLGPEVVKQSAVTIFA